MLSRMLDIATNSKPFQIQIKKVKGTRERDYVRFPPGVRLRCQTHRTFVHSTERGK